MKIILTIGDCNGIGIEVMLKSLKRYLSEKVNHGVYFSVAGNSDLISDYAKHINFEISLSDGGFVIDNNFIPCLECESISSIEFGEITESAGKLSSDAIELAVSKTLGGEYDAMVTMPVAKSSLYLAGWKYPGHTEMLADYCQSQEHLMILMTDRVRVALATIHIPLSRINQILSSELIISKTITLHECLKTDFGIDSPAIAVLGLNPHAGEDGALGEEENKIILPAINKLKVSGIRAEGPFPADGFFAHGAFRNYDAILAMYHDQGLIPLKMLAAGGGVNFTAGLPIVRTSPDHGTAYSIAGKNEANSQSSYDAIISAIEIVKRRKSIL